MIAAPWLRMGSSIERAARAGTLYRHDERIPPESTRVARKFLAAPTRAARRARGVIREPPAHPPVRGATPAGERRVRRGAFDR
ncbi:hypothetical protein BMAPRL20_0815 [Burkholderia mallei PRL-20]|uniref:Uncharacterized protein n=2 Tax=Burkholderia mallei TaxID=13373 RepID=A2RVZ9_BURM9|nr:hypothetical protein BMA10229_0042 [Burkholderia mallei NCTC 10229]ABO03070.1 hypothetical protein BMA10247_A1579 [Burkholderia mallei NCTC 10247]EDK82637.1 hypothetical protein BMA721280_K0313 [Burkholderia mallei 2002721280]EES46846.1 hypothetical protein BMAPRL20_0815 [Burkholderia mallei PRL-20]EXI97899.1 hypothetical protein T210_0135650 [Burkholderia pseudomallei MSHR6137]